MERVWVFVACCCLLLGVGCYSTAKYEEYNAGNAAFHGEGLVDGPDLDSALRAYSRVIIQDTTFVLAYNNRGNVWQLRDSLLAALGDYGPVVFNRWEEPEAFFNRAKANQKLRRYKKAIADYEQTLTNFKLKFPDSLAWKLFEPGIGWESATMEFVATPYGRAIKEALLFKGVCNRILGDYALAVQDLDRAILLDPCDPEGYFQRGNCYQQYSFEVEEDAKKCARYYNQALRDYELADSLTSRLDTFFLRNLYSEVANTLLISGRYREAREIYDSLLFRHPYDPRYYFRSGNCAQALKEFQIAIDYYTAAIDFDSTYADAYFDRANCHFVLGEKDFAAADYSLLILLKPAFADGYYMRGITRMDLNDLDGAKDDLTQAGILGHPDAFVELGDLNRRLMLADSLEQ